MKRPKNLMAPFVKPHCRTAADCRGFTMIEVIVVLIVIAILAPIIISQAFRQTDPTPLLTQADILKSHLRYAQIKSMGDTVKWGILLSDPTSYTLYKGGSKATACLPGRSPIDTGQPGDTAIYQFQNSVTITGTSVSRVDFDEWGRPVDLAGSPLTGNITVTLGRSTDSIAITISKNTGFIS